MYFFFLSIFNHFFKPHAKCKYLRSPRSGHHESKNRTLTRQKTQRNLNCYSNLIWHYTTSTEVYDVEVSVNTDRSKDQSSYSVRSRCHKETSNLTPLTHRPCSRNCFAKPQFLSCSRSFESTMEIMNSFFRPLQHC